MTSWLLLMLVAQGSGWQVAPARASVGDTVVLTREIPAIAGARARARPLDASDLLEPLAEPAVGTRDGRVVVRYAVALFRPGLHRLPMPAIDIVHPDGGLETFAGDTAVVEIGSVLPPDSTPPPRASRAPMVRPARGIAPFLLLVGGVLLASGAWVAARRRRAARPPAPPGPAAAPPVELLRWLGTGEGRAAASYAMERLRRRIADRVPGADRALATDECLAVLEQERPAWPLRELADLLRELDRARFAPLAPSDAGELVDRAGTMVERLAATKKDEEGEKGEGR